MTEFQIFITFVGGIVLIVCGSVLGMVRHNEK